MLADIANRLTSFFYQGSRLFLIKGFDICMQGSSRLYGCLGCNSPIVICRHCDRGNRYCKPCAPVMYLKARRRANTRYQSTYQGRINHAARQKRYRERQKQKVTHQTSKGQSVRDLLINKRKCATLTLDVAKKRHNKDVYCHICDEICSPFLRHDWLRSTDYKKRVEVANAKKLVFG